MQAVGIVLLSMVAAITYGVIHDQFTARICVEYFTIGHPPVFDTEDPTLLGIGWGIIATWWVGLILGVPLAFSARAGARRKRTIVSLVPTIGILLGAMGLCALSSGLVGWFLAQRGAISLVGYLAEAVPKEKHAAFLADAWAHNASYLAGFVGGIAVIVDVWRSRSLRPE